MNKLLHLLFYFFPTVLFSLEIGVIGDSISNGDGANGKSWVYFLEKELNQLGDELIIIHNSSVGGSRTDTGMNRLVKMMAEYKLDFLIITLGINDANSSIPHEIVLKNLDDMIKLAMLNDIKVMVGVIDPCQTVIWGGSYLKAFSLTYAVIQCRYPEAMLFPFLTFDILSDDRNHIGDKIHLSERGQKIVAGIIKSYIYLATWDE